MKLLAFTILVMAFAALAVQGTVANNCCSCDCGCSMSETDIVAANTIDFIDTAMRHSALNNLLEPKMMTMDGIFTMF